MAQAMIMRNAALNGSQPLAQDTRTSARKLNGGPGITGRMEPAMPAVAARIPRIIRAVVKAVPCCAPSLPLLVPLSAMHCKEKW